MMRLLRQLRDLFAYFAHLETYRRHPYERYNFTAEERQRWQQ
jgi:hypothetical protein